MSSAEVVERQAARWAALERAAQPRNLAAYFDAAVARHAGRPLWVQGEQPGGTLTYTGLAASVQRCAAALQGQGVGRGTRVGVMLPNLPTFAIAWMAIARLGAVIVPVNTHYTARELAYTLDQGEVELLVIAGDYLQVLEQIPSADLRLSPRQVIVHGGARGPFQLDWHRLLSAAAPRPGAHADPDPDDPVSILFTSGSTGMPKGCLLSHRYWVTIGQVRAAHGVPATRLLADMPFHYMGGQWRFLMAIELGATLYVYGQPSLAHFLDRLLDHKLGFCTVTNPTAKLPDDDRYRRLRLRWAASVGLQMDLHEPLERRLGAPVREIYGTTETGSVLHMPVEAVDRVGSGSCGLPVAFRRCRIAGPSGQAVQTGQSGELWVSGPGMLLGYDKRPEADASARHGEWFRTGDLARQDAEGYYYLLGRIKDVIRRSNENISASEIESVLQAMPGILEAAAVPVPDLARGEEVKVYVSLVPGLRPADLPPERILEHCRTHLARFKLPRYIEYLERLPRTHSDKIAKAELLAAKEDQRLGSLDLVEGRWR